MANQRRVRSVEEISGGIPDRMSPTRGQNIAMGITVIGVVLLLVLAVLLVIFGG
ncbi:MAG: hypothetical protein NTU97_03115 [Candidatus Magasanikbacteria bacterium]|nr:hypothetical protein [Candidatus Magasanikbacteria bacterium]